MSNNKEELEFDGDAEGNEWFDSKHPNASCEKCDTKLCGATTYFCGGPGGCDTWFCEGCHVEGGCTICKSMEEPNPLEDTKKKVIEGVREMMQQAQTRFEGKKNTWGARVDVKMSMEMAEKIQDWIWPSLAALSSCIRERAPSWTIHTRAHVRDWGLALMFNAEREPDGDVFEDIEALITDCFED
jgi:hypothetical protein